MFFRLHTTMVSNAVGRIAFGVFASALSAPVFAQNMPVAQQQMWLQMAEQTGVLQQAAACSGVSSSKLKQHLTTALQQCQLTASGMPDEQCVKQHVVQKSGVNAEAVRRCEQLAKQQQMPSSAQQQLNQFFSQPGHGNSSDKRQAQLNQLATQLQQGAAQLRSNVDTLVAASQGTTAQISAPVYPDSKILVHLPSQGSISFGNHKVTSLPGASFASTASASDILSWYQQKLPAYQYRKIELGGTPDHLLVKTAPADADYLQLLPQLPAIPHVFITAATDETKRHLPGAKTMFTLTYQPVNPG